MDCIYLAAGLGVRMNKPLPKQFLRLLGKPIIAYSLEVFEKINEISRIIVVYNKDYRQMYEDLFKNYNLSKCILTEGGKTRQGSVSKGLNLVITDKVIIHEASRPLITIDFVQSLFKCPDETAVVPVIPIPFTVSQGNDYMTAELDRSKLHNIQLPQLYFADVLRKAHENAKKEKFTATEDGILVFRLGEKVRFVTGMENNIKITTPLDLIIAENLLRGVEKL
ncbi:MAG: 2-C-methyl-D-erythritol 4-phosphate cytidylyltransferase [Candidatus Cloacimonetes bacterium]|nr:2-C-methyl-D-erythritol 4-phosphate cytidylyltransferase [Candidatus Cloacimonadota bacterium]